MHAPGSRMDITGQGIGIGRFQLGQLPPVDYLARQFITFGGKVLENLRRSGPLAGLGLRASRQAHSAKQDFTQLLGRPDIEVFSGQVVNLRLRDGLLPGPVRQKGGKGSDDRR